MSGSDLSNAPRPRQCHLKKWPDFQGYGFNLHAEKGKVGQYIGKVDPGSPSAVTGLKENDRIVEVNGVNVGNENHQQVVERIKANPNETKLLVVDKETDDYYREKKLVIRSDQPNVEIRECPDSRTGSAVTTVNAAVNGIAKSERELRPRLCVLRIKPDFQGYGFNLHAEKGKPGQFIGKVDAGSPAEAGGLQEGDHIVEINDENISAQSHADVVNRIKLSPSMVRILVVSGDDWTYAQQNNIHVHNGMPLVQVIDPSQPSAISAAPVVAAAAVVASSVDSSAPKLRLCHLKQWSDFNGYGFNLHVEKGRAGHFIGAVDDSSPAYYAGLRKGDRIAEANGNNVWDASHQETVGIIKARGNNVELLVADPAAEEYYRNKGVSINSSLPNIERIVCPDRNPATSQVTAAPVVAVANASSSSLPSDAPAPRLCVLQKRQDFQGYGFNLMVIKDRPGNYIGSIEQGSPAQISGLIENDKIIEVNGDNILEEPHANVVNKIKSNPNQVALLVLDPKADEYYQNNNLIASSSQANVQRIDPSATSSSTSEAINGTVETKPSPAVTTPVVSTSPDQGTYEDQGNRVIAAETDKIEEAMEKKDEVAVVAHQEETDIRPRTPSPPPPPPPPPMMEDLPPPPPPVEEVNVTNEVKVAEESQESEEKPPSPKMVAPIPPPPFVESPVKEEIREEKVEVQSPVTPTATTVTPTATEIASPSTPISPSSSATPIATKTPTEERPSPTVNNNVSGPGLNTGLSAAQLREQLRSKKKQDPRKGNMSLQEKKAIYDSL